jgi:hypothetical protein
MSRFAKTQASFIKTHTSREILELKKTIKILEQKLFDMNFSKELVTKENEDRLNKIEKLKKENEKLKKEKEAEVEKVKNEKENEISKIKQENEFEVSRIKKENSEFANKLKSDFFGSTKHLELKIEELEKNLKILDEENQNLINQLKNLNSGKTTRYRWKSERFVTSNYLKK